MKNEEFNEKVWEEYQELKRRIIGGIKLGIQVIVILVLIQIIAFCVTQGIVSYIWR